MSPAADRLHALDRIAAIVGRARRGDSPISAEAALESIAAVLDEAEAERSAGDGTAALARAHLESDVPEGP